MNEPAPSKFETIFQRAQNVGITPALASRLLRPYNSAAIHQAEREALRFIGMSGDESPASLLDWLSGDSTNALMARGMFDTFNKDPGTPIYLTPSVYMAMGIAAQVYIYAHQSSRIIVPDNRVADIRRLIGDPASVYGVDPYRFEEIVAFVYELAGLKAVVTQRSGDAGADILVWHPSGMKSAPLKAVQVKRYAPSNRIGIAEVQRMKGVVIDFGAGSGEIVTTSWFTKQAALSAARGSLTIELTDFNSFKRRIDEVLNSR